MPITFQEAQYLINLFYKSRLTECNAGLRAVCQMFTKYQDTSDLEWYITNFPKTINQAKERLQTIEEEQITDPLKPYPHDDELELIDGAVKIGCVNENDQQAGINPTDFTEGVFVCGRPGCGKTTLGLSILTQMLQQNRPYKIKIIQDTKRDADFLIKYFPDIKIIESKDLRLNMWQVEDWDTEHEKMNSVVEILSSTMWMMEHTGLIFKMAVKLAYQVSNETGLPVIFSTIKKQIKTAASAVGLEGYDHKNALDHINFVLETFIQTDKSMNARYGFTIEDFWNNHHVILNLMNESSPYIKSTLVMYLFKEWQRYNEKHPTPKPELRDLIYVDESRNIFPASRPHNESGHDPNKPLKDWVGSRRSSGIGYMVATQEINSAPDWLVDNSKFVIGFPIYGENRDKLLRVLNLDEHGGGYQP